MIIIKESQKEHYNNKIKSLFNIMDVVYDYKIKILSGHFNEYLKEEELKG